MEPKSAIRVVAVVLLAIVMAVGCKLRIGTSGGVGGTDGADGDWTPGGGGTGGSTETVGVDQAMVDEANALFAAQPEDLALGNLRARYTALALAMLVESSVQDPENPDLAEVEALIELHTSEAVDQANLWIATLDPATYEQAIGVSYDFPLHCIYHYCVRLRLTRFARPLSRAQQC